MVSGISSLSAVNQVIPRQNGSVSSEESKEPAGIPDNEKNEVGGAPVKVAAASSEEASELNDSPAEERRENGGLGNSVNIQA